MRAKYTTGTLTEKFWAKVVLGVATEDCWGWVGAPTPKGYGTLGHGGKMLKAHRLSWELHNGSIPDGLCVLHSCDNPPCCNPRHLFLGTKEDNVADMVSKGRQAKGSRASGSKLTEKARREIVVAPLTVSAVSLARFYGVSAVHVRKLRSGKTR